MNSNAKLCEPVYYIFFLLLLILWISCQNNNTHGVYSNTVYLIQLKNTETDHIFTFIETINAVDSLVGVHFRVVLR